MDSMPAPLLSSPPLELTNKQNELIQQFETILATHGIKLIINELYKELEGQTVSLDVEHDESGGYVGCGISVVGNSRVYYFSDLSILSRVPFKSLSIVAHNGKGDLECLRQWGINVSNDQLLWDTMLIGHVLDSSLKSYGLKDMAKRELGIDYPSYDDIVGKRTKKQSHERITLDKQPEHLVAMYNACDVYFTGQLYNKQVNRKGTSSKEERYFDQIEKPVSFIFQAMENRGVCIDLAYLKELKAELEAQQAPIRAEILNELGPINLNSPPQLLKALRLKGFNPRNRKGSSTDKEAIAKLPDCDLKTNLQQFGELETLLSTFVRKYLERNETVVHCFFNQCGTRTGRPSCSNPNLLQIPRRTENGKKVRQMFIPRPGMLMGDCDFGQIEPRVMAHLSKDTNMCQMFNDGIDFHGFTAENLGIDRDRAKILNLSVGYRATFKSVSSQLKCTDKEAQNEIDKWWDLFPSLRRWQDKLIYDSKRSGYCTTLMGRRIKVVGLESGNKWERESAERQLINNLIQGSAAEIMKLAMIRIHKYIANFSPGFGLLVQVYDELLFESPTAEADIEGVQEAMQHTTHLDVPLTVDGGIGDNWNACKGN